jgi:hypothetical protein
VSKISGLEKTPRGCSQTSPKGMFICTDHTVTSDGETLHLACGHSNIAAMWIDPARYINFDDELGYPSRPTTYKQAFDIFADRFLIPVTEEELDAAAKKVAALLRQLELKTRGDVPQV